MSGDSERRDFAGSDFERVAELYERALAEPRAARDAWLRAACADDSDLRAEVASLLAGSDDADTFFDTLADGIARIPPEELDGVSRVGERIGPYEIEAELGRGGMGVVYRARDTRLGRLVAIKLLPAWLAHDPAARERLIAEARAAGAIDHPNIGALHDVVEAPDGSVALVLAHYEGETLRARLERGSLEPAHALDVARQVALGLAAAHERGIVHRDVKPGNLLLAADGRVKILDFGVAVTSADEADAARRAGTVAYMSPEQVRGDAAGPASDLWSLGVVLHEMLAGERPFRGSDEADTMRAVLEHEPAPLAHAAGGDVVGRLLERDPARRLADANAVVGALDAALAELALHARDGAGSRRRARRGVALAGLALAALLGLAAWQAVRSDDDGGSAAAGIPISDDRLAVLPFAMRGGEDVAWLGAGVADLLSAALDDAGGLRTVDPGAIAAELDAAAAAGDRPGAAALAGRFGAGRFVTGEVVAAAGRARVEVTLYTTDAPLTPVGRFYVDGPVERLFELVDEIASRVLIADRRGADARLVRTASITTASLPAFRAYLDGDRALREGRFSDAIDAFQAATALDSAFALAHYGMAVAAGWSYRGDLATDAAEAARTHADRLPSTERQLVEALVAWPEGRLERAELLYRTVLQGQPATVEAWFNLGELYFHMNTLRGRPMAEAREPFERVLERVGYEHYESLVHLADLAARERRYDDYRALHDRLNPAGELADVYDLQYRMIVGSEEERAAALAQMRDVESARIRLVAGRLAAFAAHPEQATRVSRLLTEPSRSADWRAIGHLMTAVFDAGLDRWDSAAAQLERAHTIAPGPALVMHAHLWSLSFAPDDDAAIETLRTRLRDWKVARTPREPHPLLAVHEPHYATLRTYLLGSLALRAGDRQEAARSAQQLESSADDPALARALARELRARLSSDPAAAARLLLESRETASYARAAVSPFQAASSARWHLAEALEAAGRPDEAAAWYQSALGPFLDDVVFTSESRRRLAALGR